jgi:hypothetical protein
MSASRVLRLGQRRLQSTSTGQAKQTAGEVGDKAKQMASSASDTASRYASQASSAIQPIVNKATGTVNHLLGCEEPAAGESGL